MPSAPDPLLTITKESLMEKRCILMIGLPGSGKSTYVNTALVPHGFQVICQDEIRRAYGHRFSGPLEPFVHTMAYMQARQLMLRGLPVVIDEATCKAGHLRLWKSRAEAMGYAVSAVYVDTPVDLCKRRRASTPEFPSEVIDWKDADLRRDWQDILDLFPDMTTISTDDACRDGGKPAEQHPEEAVCPSN